MYCSSADLSDGFVPIIELQILSTIFFFVVSALIRHWISAGNLLPPTGLQLHMFFLAEKTWLCLVWHAHANLGNLRRKPM